MSRLETWLQEFKTFVLRGNVVDLAVAFVIGAAFTAVVTAVVNDWITPLIGAIFGGKGAFGDLSFTIHRSDFQYGHFINALVSFVSIAAVVFFLVVKPMNYFVARMKRGQEPVAEIPPDIQLLTEIRDLLKARG